jgi:glycosyltransferase involved in cell wall biosynthesis
LSLQYWDRPDGHHRTENDCHRYCCPAAAQAMKKVLRILMISPAFRPLVGGYERAAERLSSALCRVGYRVTVITERRDKTWPRKEVVDQVTVVRVWCVYRMGIHVLTSLMSFAVFLLTRGYRYHVFHVHQYGYHAALAVVVGRLLRKPVLIKVTSTSTEGIAAALASGRFSRPMMALHRAVSACIVTSTEAAREAIQFGIPEERIKLLPNGIDIDEFRPATDAEKLRFRIRFGITSSLVVLYSGRLVAFKNVAGLIESWSEIHRDVDAVLVIVGDGPLRSTLEAKCRYLGLASSVRFIGQQSDVMPWYQVADVFVLSSHYEGLSNSLLEAMSCGLPVASTRVSGSVDIFADVDIGELTAPGDAGAMATAIARLLADPARRAACGSRARSYAMEKYSINSVANDTSALYEHLVSR